MKKNKFLKKILWTALFGGLEIGVLIFSNYLSSIRWFKNTLMIFFGMLVFFILSYIIEWVEDK